MYKGERGHIVSLHEGANLTARITYNKIFDLLSFNLSDFSAQFPYIIYPIQYNWVLLLNQQ